MHSITIPFDECNPPYDLEGPIIINSSELLQGLPTEKLYNFH